MGNVTRGRARELSDGALLVEYPGALDDAANQAATALGRDLAERRPSGLLDAIPGARTLLLLFDPFAFERSSLEPLLVSPERPATDAQRTVRIPVCYGGEFGPDLEELSRERNMVASEFARRHRDPVYRVAFIGFAPGFAYLVGLPAELHAPRLQSPRTRVPAGSVGIGGPYTGIYPSDTPGGWRLIGNSPVRLFDPSRSPPSSLRPGDRVAFEEIDQREHQRLRESSAPPVSSASDSASPPVLRVLSPGLFTSVQGAPRFGLGSSGVPSGGAMDLPSLARANAAVGNDLLAPGLEVTLSGPRLEVCEDCRICVAGSEIDAAIDGAPLPNGRACIVRAGAQLTLGAVRRGARAYLAIDGGIEGRSGGVVTRRLERGDELIRAQERDSQATVASGAAPPATESSGTAGPSSRQLRATKPFGTTGAGASWSADVGGSRGGGLGTRLQAIEFPGVDVMASGLPAEETTVRVVLGPQEEYFTQAGLSAFLSTRYRVSPQSDRRGARLEGARIELAGPPDIPPEGTAPGAIQVPGDGLPIVLGPDRPVTGGYAKIATVIGADLPVLGQLRPGMSIRFRAVSIPDAIAARRG